MVHIQAVYKQQWLLPNLSNKMVTSDHYNNTPILLHQYCYHQWVLMHHLVNTYLIFEKNNNYINNKHTKIRYTTHSSIIRSIAIIIWSVIHWTTRQSQFRSRTIIIIMTYVTPRPKCAVTIGNSSPYITKLII